LEYVGRISADAKQYGPLGQPPSGNARDAKAYSVSTGSIQIDK
jgi:hypothetical protein